MTAFEIFLVAETVLLFLGFSALLVTIAARS